jgi:hypothetical protein
MNCTRTHDDKKKAPYLHNAIGFTRSVVVGTELAVPEDLQCWKASHTKLVTGSLLDGAVDLQAMYAELCACAPLTLASATGGSFLASFVAAFSYSGVSFLQCPHLQDKK